MVRSVMVGDAHGIVLPALTDFRGGGSRLKGLRLVHTHLAGEPLSNDDLMDLLFLRLDMMAAVTMDEKGLPGKVHAAHLVPRGAAAGDPWHLLAPVHPAGLPHDCLDTITALEDEFSRLTAFTETRGHDRAILVSVHTSGNARVIHEARESMNELVELAKSAGCVVLETVMQRVRKINPKWLLGKGKLAEVMLSALQLDANLLVFDQELNPSQIRSITDHTDLKVIDRTQLILDIFARRAKSREGKLQIEMAQLKYMLPRLGQRDDALSRLTGGIGGRGPGETRLEIDRRRINDRLARLAKQLKEVGRERHQRRRRRRQKEVPVLSLIGYTNAGKSTLLNTLTRSEVTAEDRLFATLDPTSRRLRFPRETEVVITDTVGFIRHLPAELLKAFAATLEELNEADLLLHVVDISNPRYEQQIKAVETITHELGLDAISTILVLNKTDRADPELVRRETTRLNAIAISALDPATLPPLLQRAESMLT